MSKIKPNRNRKRNYEIQIVSEEVIQEEVKFEEQELSPLEPDHLEPVEEAPITQELEKVGRLPEELIEITDTAEPMDVNEPQPEPLAVETSENKETEKVEAEASVVEEDSLLSNDDQEQLKEAIKIVHRWSAWAASAGLIPLPLADLVGLIAAQMQMLKRLSLLYGIAFDSQRSKAAIAMLASGINAAYLSGSAAKFFPVFGVLSIASMPAINGAITYAVGLVFIQHFASGGTFLDFDAAKVKGHFYQMYLEGKLYVANK